MKASGLLRTTVFAASVALSSLCNHAHAVNLVVNPGFETGNFSGWTQSGDLSFTTVSNQALFPHTGVFGASFGPTPGLGFISQAIPTVAGEKYNLSFWLRNVGVVPNDFRVSWDNSIIASLSLHDVPPFPYALFSVNGLVATSATTTIQFGFFHNPSFWAFDDVLVELAPPTGQVPDAGSSILLLGASLIGLAFVRRWTR